MRIGPEVQEGTAHDNGDGTYKVDYDIEVTGDFTMDVLVAGEHIENSPFTVKARPGGTVAEKTTIERAEKSAKGGSEALLLQLRDAKGNARDTGGGTFLFFFFCFSTSCRAPLTFISM